MNYLSKICILSLFFINSTIHPMQSGLPKAARIMYALQKRTMLDFNRINFDVVSDEINKNKNKSAPVTPSNSTLNSSRSYYQTATEYGEYIHGKKVKLGDFHQNIIGLPTFTPVSSVTLQNNNETSLPAQEMTLPELNFELLRSYLHLKKQDNDPVDLCDDHERDKFHKSFKKNNSAKSLINEFFTAKQNTLKNENKLINSADNIDKLIAQRFGVKDEASDHSSVTKLNNETKIQELTQQQNYMRELLQQQHKLEKAEEEKERLRTLEYDQQVAAWQKITAERKAIHDAKYSTKIINTLKNSSVYTAIASKVDEFVESKLSQSKLPSDHKSQTPLEFFESSMKKREHK